MLSIVRVHWQVRIYYQPCEGSVRKKFLILFSALIHQAMEEIPSLSLVPFRLK
jgi:hypothetical protein